MKLKASNFSETITIMTTELTYDPSDLRIDTYAQEAYLQYAVSVVKDRALAQVEDGLKPVHRRILYAMRQLGLTHEAKPVKSARIVGDVLGKYHPHGDSSVYDALVRVAQDFSLRYPLISGQGNFGSRDGDGAAAMRYTEARLSPISKLLLEELGQGTVNFRPNYDGSQEEPVLLPARLPFMLLNGTMGIAVGMASNIPSHNIREVCSATIAVLENPSISLEEVLTHMPGPDFPDGGQLISSPAEIHAAYSSGRGPLRVRARWSKEELARGQWQIVISELPYQVSTKNILEQLDTLSNPQIPSGKKSLTQQQLNLKAITLDFLDSARDESGQDAKVRIVLTPRNAKVDADGMMAFLLANTALEDSFGLNATMLGYDGHPATKGLLEILKEWCEFRVATVRRRTQFELDQTTKRVHILAGRMTVFLNIDAVVKVIREAEDPKVDLTTSFSLSDIQAEDILEMRLRQLNRLEGFKLEKELSELRSLAERLSKLLASEAAMRKLVITEIKGDCDKHGDDRRTLIKPESRITQVSPVKTVLEEPVTLVVSKNMWVRAYKGTGLSEDSFVFKASDQLAYKAEGSTTMPLVILDDKGRVYSFASSDVPMKGEGAPLSTFIELQENAKVVSALSGTGDSVYLFSNDSGYGFTAPLKSLWARPKAGKAFLTLSEGEKLLPPFLVPDVSVGYVVGISAEAKLLAFEAKELASRPSGGRGVVLMSVEPGQLLRLSYTKESEIEFAAKTENGKPIAVRLSGAEWLKHVGKRARKGAFLPKKAIPL
jgi:topoisomerase IV subunit A